MSSDDLHEPNPINDDPEQFPSALWDRRNTGEANPGVATPMTASNSRRTDAASQLRLFRLLGAATDTEMGGPDGSASPHYGRLVAYFYGRRALDTTSTLGFLGRLPGVRAEALAEQVFGERVAVPVEPLSPARTVRAVALMARAATRLPRWTAERVEPTRIWWMSVTRRCERAGWQQACSLLGEAQERYRREVSYHAANLVFHTAFAEQTNERAGRHLEGQEVLRLHAGVEGLAEPTMLADLWVAARGGDLDAFRARYGYYAPDEGELATRSWRVDISSLQPTVDQYRSAGPTESPDRRLGQSRSAHDATVAELIRSAGRAERPVLRFVLGATKRFALARERSKAMMLQTTDAVRAAIRRCGTLMADGGVIDGPDDVFMLTLDDLSANGESLRSLVERRRALCAAYEDLEIPLSFTGDALRSATTTQISSPPIGGRIEGVGVSAGEITARAVVMTSPSPSDVHAGDVLVCVTTDPGWSAMLSMAGAVVMDMGSALSHGAIVARELGIPCVANVGDGTRRIVTGQTVRVDGGSGIVEVVDARAD